MSDNIRLVDPLDIRRNEENPRLIFNQEDLDALEESISRQGILVPLTVFDNEDKTYTILDGERRWRCAKKLGHERVPVIIQPKPDLVTNIMMMFAIHKARSDWDPLPTALKLERLETILQERMGRPPTEADLAAAASLSRGEIRRYRRILALPQKFKDELMLELEKPRSQQILTVDHVMEAAKGAESLSKRNIISTEEEITLTDSLVNKFRNKTLKSTVEPRELPKIARAVERGDISANIARSTVLRLINDSSYTVKKAFTDTVEKVELYRSTEILASRLNDKIRLHIDNNDEISESLKSELRKLSNSISMVV